MTIPAASKASFGDFEALSQLKHADRSRTPEALREAAKQFESLFTRMLLKSMRETSFGDSLTGEQGDFYQGMFDDQLAIELSKGRGLGLADMLVQQLARAGLVPAEGTSTPDQAMRLPGARGTIDPSRTSEATGSASFAPASREDFVRQLWPDAQAAARELGVDPRTLIAHAALETGWGRHFPQDAQGRSSLNLFGIKATGAWQGDSVGSRTLEFVGGVAQVRTEPFRAYGSASESFKDYVSLLSGNSRYREALGTGNDVRAFGDALQRGGYATDPHYAEKLARVANQIATVAPEAMSNVTSLKVQAGAPITEGNELSANRTPFKLET